MKFLLTLACTFAVVLAELPSQGGYSGGSGSFNFGDGGYTTGNGGGSGNVGAAGYLPAGGASAQGPVAPQGPQVFRYVSVHTAPEDPSDQETKVVRVPGGNNKHVNIIFVKTPSNGADQKTEIVLPEQDEQKSLVYVLVKKTDPTANLKISQPPAVKPSKPEVYFIRYKNAQQTGQGQAAGTGGFNSEASGVPGSAFGSPSSAYGAPSAAYGAP